MELYRSSCIAENFVHRACYSWEFDGMHHLSAMLLLWLGIFYISFDTIPTLMDSGWAISKSLVFLSKHLTTTQNVLDTSCLQHLAASCRVAPGGHSHLGAVSRILYFGVDFCNFAGF